MSVILPISEPPRMPPRLGDDAEAQRRDNVRLGLWGDGPLVTVGHPATKVSPSGGVGMICQYVSVAVCALGEIAIHWLATAVLLLLTDGASCSVRNLFFEDLSLLLELLSLLWVRLDPQPISVHPREVAQRSCAS